MNRRVVAILLAILLAAAAAVLVLYYLGSADKRAVADQEPTTVYVTTEVIPSGTTLRDAQRKELLEETQVPAASVPMGALKEIGPENTSLLALSEIAPGEVLLDARFGTTPLGTRAIEVPSGMLAMSVELTDPARVGQFVTPGSHIAIYRNGKLTPLGDSPREKQIRENDFRRTSVLIADVQVIGMGQTALSAPQPVVNEEGEPTNAQPSFLVTVAVTPDQALVLAHQAMNGEMYAGLRGSDVDVDPKGAVDDLNWPGGLP